MKMSAKGRGLLIQWEGVKRMAYLDTGGKLTIGCGHLLTEGEIKTGLISINNVQVKYEQGLSLFLIDGLLSKDLIDCEKAVNALVNIVLTQDQFDALVSFSFNVGVPKFTASTLLSKINGGYFSDVEYQFRRWNKVSGRVDKGLVNRRESEIKLWNGGFDNV